MAGFAEASRGVVAIDGKVLRRSFDTASGRSPLHMVSAWACEQQLVLGQIATEAKSNEITAVPKLLEMLSLKGTIVTTDALNCQRAIAQQIIDQGGDYVLALKGNQGTLHDDVSLYLDDPVQLFVPARDLRHWGANGWELASGQHTVFVGPSADPAQLKSATFNVGD